VKGDVVTSEAVFVPRPEDTGSEFRCEATNDAIQDPISKTIRIQVQPQRSTTQTTTTTTKKPTTTVAAKAVTHFDDYESDLKAAKKVNEMDSNYFYNDEYRDAKRGAQVPLSYYRSTHSFTLFFALRYFSLFNLKVVSNRVPLFSFLFPFSVVS